MSTSVIEPGTRLAGRYRLDDRVSEAGGSTFWKATDEILARPVAVLTFAPGFPRVAEVVTAARAASRLTDPRLTQVFDADDSGERAYVVSEWVTGDTLEDLVAPGPMPPDRAAAFLLEAAEALASAHAAGLAHLCLTPRNLVWTSGGTVKITGLGVEAVLSGTTSDTPALDDTRGLGTMLYAALTGCWPGPENTLLPPAPTGADGRPLPPSQVRAGVPHNLDLIACRALHIAARGAQEPLTAPSALADALSRVPRAPLPFVPLSGSTPPAVITRPDQQPVRDQTAAMPDAAGAPGRTAPSAPPAAPPRSARHTAGGGTGGGLGRPALAAIAAIVVVVAVIGVWGLTRMGGGGDDGNKAKARVSAPPVARQTLRELKPANASVDNRPPHADTSASNDADKAIDGSKGSYWTTQHYTSARFGGLRSGIGLVLNMGRTVSVGKVKVTMPGSSSPGTVELHIGDSADHGTPEVATADASGTFELDGKQTKGQYVTLWFTKLPNIGEFKIKVSDVAVYGTD